MAYPLIITKVCYLFLASPSLNTLTVTELPTNGTTLQVEVVQHQLVRLRTALHFHSQENKKTKRFAYLAGGY